MRWLGRPPLRNDVPRRPVVAILDTGVADHTWFDAPATTRSCCGTSTTRRQRCGPRGDHRGRGGETDPNLIDPLEGLIDPFFGHGTFIAGLIHQACPGRAHLSIKMMGNDGIVEEAALINGLGFLHQRQVEARATGDRRRADRRRLACRSATTTSRPGAASATTPAAAGASMRWPSRGSWSSPRPATTPRPGRCSRPRSPLSATARLPDGARRPRWSASVPSTRTAVSPCSATAGTGSPATAPGAALVSTLPRSTSDSDPGSTSARTASDRQVGSWRATHRPRQLHRLRHLERDVIRGPGRGRRRGPGAARPRLAAHKAWPRQPPASCAASCPSSASSSRTDSGHARPRPLGGRLIIDERDASDEHATSTWARTARSRDWPAGQASPRLDSGT